MKGKSTLANFLLALRPALPSPMRRRVVRLALSLRPDSLDVMQLALTDAKLGERERADALATLRSSLATRLLDQLQDRGKGPAPAAERFLATVLRLLDDHPSTMRAQLLQDAWAYHASGCKRNGYFVEFGAYDGVALSNTLLLEREFGWTGLLAEPNPRFEDSLRRNRTATIDTRCVWSKSGETLRFADCDELGTILGQGTGDAHAARRAAPDAIVEVESVSLDDLLDAHGTPRRFDFLSIDTEGSELEILRSFTFERFRPHTVAVEHNFTTAERELDELLAAKGYVRVFRGISRWDAWYESSD